MVILKNIKRISDGITCDAFVEDAKAPVFLSLSRDGMFRSGSLPDGYEYCTTHITKAKWYLTSIMDAECIPENWTIMWY